MLTLENYSKGFLIDEELMGGVTADPEQPDVFVAFVLRHTTGEYLGYQPFSSIEEALAKINSVTRAWTYETVNGCGNGNCGNGQCKGGGCAAAKKLSKLDASLDTGSETATCAPGAPCAN